MTRFHLLLALAAVLSTTAFAQGPRIDIHLDPQPAISGGCPAKVHFTGSIRTYEPVEVTYQWLRSDGSHTEHTLSSTLGKSHPIAVDWQLNKSLNGWMQLVIVAPKHLQTIKANFSVNCGH
ncbi:MAG TPA: hypothetical protein VFB04_11050 [Terriglobales bacterium]|nr:hypothetical protein [Terriglobales bacterium]